MGLVHSHLPDSAVVCAIVGYNCRHCGRQERGERSMLGGDAYRNIRWLEWAEHLVQLVRKSMPLLGHVRATYWQYINRPPNRRHTWWQSDKRADWPHTHTLGRKLNNGMHQALRCHQEHKSCDCVSLADDSTVLNIPCVRVCVFVWPGCVKELLGVSGCPPL